MKVEVCSLFKTIKYIYKYVFKNNDQITIQLQKKNIKVAYQINKQYIGPTQAT